MPKKLIATVLVTAAFAAPAAAHLDGSEGHNAGHGLTMGLVALSVLTIAVAAHRIARRARRKAL
ncbi:MAG: hypothetical protein AAF317_12490 [Pseudomonadota bacterium]